MIDRRYAQALCRICRGYLAGNTMHPMWDVVFDAEAALEGRETLMRDGSEQVLVWCVQDMEKFLISKGEVVEPGTD